METNPVSSGMVYSADTTATGSSALGKDDFLQILVAQLQNQDPTQPMDDTQFISQMAQFSALEQMQQLNASFGYSQAYALLGKNISAQVSSTDGTQSTVTGTVSGVTTINSQPYLCVNGNYVSLDLPITVNGSSSDDLLMQGASMIGKYITGTYTDNSGTIQQVAGTVDKMDLVNGSIVLHVGTHSVNLSDVSSVAASAPTTT